RSTAISATRNGSKARRKVEVIAGNGGASLDLPIPRSRVETPQFVSLSDAPDGEDRCSVPQTAGTTGRGRGYLQPGVRHLALEGARDTGLGPPVGLISLHPF